jgi:signal peptidase I
MSSVKRLLREYLPFMIAVLCLMAARSSLADHYIVPSGSMEPTLVSGDRVVVDKQAYGLRLPFTLLRISDGARPTRGDVIIFDSPGDGTRLIKRVAAVGGDTLEVRSGHLLINGHFLMSDAGGRVEAFGERMATLNLRYGGGPDVGPITVPAGQVFVLGDARGNSRDSRFFGFVHESGIYARALGVFYRSGEGFVWRPL